MTISKKLLLTLFVALLSVLAVGSYGTWQLSQAQDRFQYVMLNTLPSLDAMSSARKGLNGMRVGLRDYLIAETAEQKDSAKNAIKVARGNFDAAIADYAANDISNDADRQLLDADKAAMTDYQTVVDQIVAEAETGNHAQAVNKLKQAAQQAGLINKAMDDHYKFNTDLAAQLASQNLAAFSLARFLSIASIVIAFVLTGILAAQLYLTIRTGLNQISQSLIRVSDTLNFRDRVEVKRQDEIGQATTALNRLLDKLQNSFHDLRSIADDVGSASQGLMETAKQVSIAATAQSESSANMAATIEEMTVSINHVAEQTKATHAGAIESTQLVSSGSAIIHQTIEDIHEISGAVKQSVSSIQQLEIDSGKVGTVIGVIRDIADQTNLLALNAAIEAARAGEQGRGFAVVADEVRKLAERTAKSTQEISATIQTMMSRAQEATTQMGSAEQLVATGVSRADEANKAIQQIGAHVTTATENVSEISSAIQQQGEASNNIAVQVEHTAQMSEESSAAAKQTAESAAHLDGLVKRQKETLAQFLV